MYHGSNDIGIGHDGYPVRGNFTDPVDLEPLIAKALNIHQPGLQPQQPHSVPVTYLEAFTDRGDAMNLGRGTGVDGSVFPHPVDVRPHSCDGVARSNINDPQDRINNGGSSRPFDQGNTDTYRFGTTHEINASDAKGAANLTNSSCQYIQANTGNCGAAIVPEAITLLDQQRINGFYEENPANHKSSNKAEKDATSEEIIHECASYTGDVSLTRMGTKAEGGKTYIRPLPATALPPRHSLFNATFRQKGKIRTERTLHHNQTTTEDSRATFVPRMARQGSVTLTKTPTSGAAASARGISPLTFGTMNTTVSPTNSGTDTTSWGTGNQASVKRPWARYRTGTRTGPGDHTSIDRVDEGTPDGYRTGLGAPTPTNADLRTVAGSLSHVNDGLASSRTLVSDLKAVRLASGKRAAKELDSQPNSSAIKGSSTGEAIYTKLNDAKDDKTGKLESEKAKVEEKLAYVEEDEDWYMLSPLQ